MLVRCLAALSISLCVVGAHADCDPSAAEPVESARARFERTQAELDAAPPNEQGTAGFRARQERALQELERLQCAVEKNAPTEAVSRAPGTPTPYATIPVLFVTDRAQIKSATGAISFSGDRQPKSAGSEGVAYGTAVVRMPAENYQAGPPVPYGVTLTNQVGARDGVTVDPPVLFDRDELSKAIDEYKKGRPAASPVRLLLFVHGFNVTYADAIKAVARLAWGLRINVLPVAITWPSQGDIVRYWQDEQSVESSTERLRPVFAWLLNNPRVDEVIIVAHSMGTRLVTRELSDLDLQKLPLTKLVRVTFAAADLPDEQFSELWPRLSGIPGKGWLLYTSRNDIALMASGIVHFRPPVGDSRKRVFSIKQADTVDATAVAPALTGYGHSYVIDNPKLQLDLRRWIAQGTPPADRDLQRGNRPPADFWIVPD